MGRRRRLRGRGSSAPSRSGWAGAACRGEPPRRGGRQPVFSSCPNGKSYHQCQMQVLLWHARWGMRIGELAKRTGVSERSLRYYEKQGLLTAERTLGGHRDYPDGAVDRVIRIQELF